MNSAQENWDEMEVFKKCGIEVEEIQKQIAGLVKNKPAINIIFPVSLCSFQGIHKSYLLLYEHLTVKHRDLRNR